ncbi:hypothetical protein GS881_21495 [Rhodococcus hoagii]|nr:hypothetical protein [Prescottella equi]
MVLENGSATVTHNFGSAGTHQITAEYLPGAGFLASTSTQYPVAVSAPNPSDVVSSILMSSAQSTTVGTAFTLEAQVTGAQTLPGTVQFFDGGVEIGSPVAVVDGLATIVHTFTSTGPHHVHAVYSGGTGVAGSTSPVQVLDVSEAGGGTGVVGRWTSDRWGARTGSASASDPLTDGWPLPWRQGPPLVWGASHSTGHLSGKTDTRCSFPVYGDSLGALYP